MIRKICVLFLMVLASRAWGVELTAGPMVGHVTDKTARVWMQFPIAGEVTVNAFDVERNQAVSGVRVGLEGPTPFVCDIPVSNLQPNRTYRIEVKFDGEALKLPGPELVLRTAPSPGEEAAFSVAFGGGVEVMPLAPGTLPAAQTAPAAAAHKLPIFRAITELKPRAFIFLGNTGMLPAKLDDFPATHRAAYRYVADFHSLIRREPDLQPLLRTTPCYAVFNDRDFGPADSDANYVFAQESLVAFQRFWPNPDWGTPQNPGCYSTFTFGDVDFFLVDTRTFRREKELLGAAQLAWLEKNLKAATGAFKVIAAPCTLWGDDPQHPEADSWSRYPAEQQGFLKWLGENQITGVVGITGGRAAGGLEKYEPDAGMKIKYPLFTVGCSTLAGAATGRDTFGTLDFSGLREHRFVTLRLRDETGKTRAEQVVLAVQLRG